MLNWSDAAIVLMLAVMATGVIAYFGVGYAITRAAMHQFGR